jgi:hypothetical protein
LELPWQCKSTYKAKKIIIAVIGRKYVKRLYQ